MRPASDNGRSMSKPPPAHPAVRDAPPLLARPRLHDEFHKYAWHTYGLCGK